MQKNKLFSILWAMAVALNGNTQVVKLDAIIDSIKTSHPVVKMYENEIRSMDEAAKGAKSWMPPEFSTGFWMTPYDPSLWKKTDDGMGGTKEGMGQYMIGGQQMFPNKRKQNANASYMQAMSSVEKEKKNASLNDLISDAKQYYFEWIILTKKISILNRDERLLDFMIKNAEIRYKNGLEKISAYYKAKAALGNLQIMRLMFENDIREKRTRINTLMNRDPYVQFDIDTTFILSDYTNTVFDSTLFYTNRSDLKAIDREINLARLKQESEIQDSKVQFGIRFEHMFGFGGLPMQYSLMGMVRLPLGYSSRMNKANAESLKWKADALQSEKQMMMIEYRSMAYNMLNELELKKKQLKLYNDDLLPALQNNYKTTQLGYEQNTEELFMLFDAWETLYMTQLEYTELLNQALKLQVTLERLIEKK